MTVLFNSKRVSFNAKTIKIVLFWISFILFEIAALFPRIESQISEKKKYDFQVVASDSNLDKIVADFIKVEDQNFALFNYVTEMNNQVRQFS